MQRLARLRGHGSHCQITLPEALSRDSHSHFHHPPPFHHCNLTLWSPLTLHSLASAPPPTREFHRTGRVECATFANQFQKSRVCVLRRLAAFRPPDCTEYLQLPAHNRFQPSTTPLRSAHPSLNNDPSHRRRSSKHGRLSTGDAR